MGGVFFNKGENCIAAGRVFVESSIHDKFIDKVVEEVKKIVSKSDEVAKKINKNECLYLYKKLLIKFKK